MNTHFPDPISSLLSPLGPRASVWLSLWWMMLSVSGSVYNELKIISFTFLSYLSCLAVFVVTDNHYHPLQLHLMRKHECFTRCWFTMWFVQTQMIFWKISKDEGLPLNVIINEACICFYCISSTLTEFFRQITCYTHSQNIALAGSSENIVWRRHASESLHFVAVPKPQMFFQPSYSSKTHCLVLKSAICIFTLKVPLFANYSIVFHLYVCTFL